MSRTDTMSHMGKKGGAPSMSEEDADFIRGVMREVMHRLEMTTTALAKELRISQPSLSQILSGKTKPSMQTVVNLSMVSGVSPSALTPSILSAFGAAPKKYPSKVQATWACLEVGLPAEAIRRMWDDDPDFLNEDPGARWWFQRADGFAASISGTGNARGPILPGSSTKALPPAPKRRKHTKAN